MTNEELTVLATIATQLVESQKKGLEDENNYFKFLETNRMLEKDKERLLSECNRLRESEANALNAEREAACDRDEARKKFGEWVLFINDTIYTALVKATERKDCRKIVKDAVNAMRKFIFEHPVEVIEGELEK